DERANIIVEMEGKDPNLPPIIFNGHLDTVPVGNKENWVEDPFSGVLKDGKIYGRGACDMKSGIAGLLESMINIKNSGIIPETNIIFIGTIGEEVDCIGAKEVVKTNILGNAGAMVIAEPSNNK